jgi:hypothetical protein
MICAFVPCHQVGVFKYKQNGGKAELEREVNGSSNLGNFCRYGTVAQHTMAIVFIAVSYWLNMV